MLLKFWCSKCERPCYIEKTISEKEEEEEFIKNIRCPFGKKEHSIIKAI